MLSDFLITAFVGSFGSGKTVTNIHKALQNRFAVNMPKYQVMFYEPSHSLLESVAYPTLMEILPKYGLEIGKNCSFVGNPKVLTVPPYGEIRFNSLTDATKVMGANVASIHVDECDRIPEKVMTEAFKQFFGRLRVASEDIHIFEGMSRVNLSSTPEGFKFLYKHFDEGYTNGKFPDRKLIRADIWSNPFIDVETFVRQNDHLPEELKRAYFNAEFVNLQSGSVYNYFSRSQATFTPDFNYQDSRYDVFIGCDFNIQHMAAVIAIKDENGDILIVDEVLDSYDTYALIDDIKNKITHLNSAIIFPDASGRNRHTSSEYSNIDLLRNAGFKSVRYDDSGNPRIQETVNLINTLFKNDRIKVSCNCVNLISALEQQVYDSKGEPDKSSGVDHILDSLRYLVYGLENNNNTVHAMYQYR
jgi:hypothetical protein